MSSVANQGGSAVCIREWDGTGESRIWVGRTETYEEQQDLNFEDLGWDTALPF